ncbi:HDOD domain-containing protein [Viridibacterium curvum]|uniref:HDOD domain-containing protein n=1 Tax=Viridibacterium curvum TaxID=1101404 RepID=A0ABP9QH36_9RHOO
MYRAQELVASLDKLASLPSVYYRIRDKLDDPDATIAELTQEIASDPALSTAVLRVANSAMYGLPRRVDSIGQALNLIGLRTLGDIVLTSSIATTFGGIHAGTMDMLRFWRSSVRCALLCRVMAEQRGDVLAERMFLLGLLSDMGHLVMYQAIPDLSDLVLSTGGLSLEQRAAREREVIGCDFAEVGVALAHSWRLPVSLGVTLGAQLQPEQAGDLAPQAACIRFARHLDDDIESDVALDDLAQKHVATWRALSGAEDASVSALVTAAEASLLEMLVAMGLAH